MPKRQSANPEDRPVSLIATHASDQEGRPWEIYEILAGLIESPQYASLSVLKLATSRLNKIMVRLQPTDDLRASRPSENEATEREMNQYIISLACSGQWLSLPAPTEAEVKSFLELSPPPDIEDLARETAACAKEALPLPTNLAANVRIWRAMFKNRTRSAACVVGIYERPNSGPDVKLLVAGLSLARFMHHLYTVDICEVWPPKPKDGIAEVMARIAVAVERNRYFLVTSIKVIHPVAAAVATVFDTRRLETPDYRPEALILVAEIWNRLVEFSEERCVRDLMNAPLPHVFPNVLAYLQAERPNCTSDFQALTRQAHWWQDLAKLSEPGIPGMTDPPQTIPSALDDAINSMPENLQQCIKSLKPPLRFGSKDRAQKLLMQLVLANGNLVTVFDIRLGGLSEAQRDDNVIGSARSAIVKKWKSLQPWLGMNINEGEHLLFLKTVPGRRIRGQGLPLITDRFTDRITDRDL